MMPRIMLRVKDVAEEMGVSQHTVGVWINSGELAAVNVGRKPGGKPIWRISAEALEEFQASRTKAPALPRRRRKRQPEGEVQFY